MKKLLICVPLDEFQEFAAELNVANFFCGIGMECLAGQVSPTFIYFQNRTRPRKCLGDLTAACCLHPPITLSSAIRP